MCSDTTLKVVLSHEVLTIGVNAQKVLKLQSLA